MSIISKYVKQLRRRDPAFEQIHLDGWQLIDSDLVDLIDCLLCYPNDIAFMRFARNYLTDVTGCKLASCVAASSTIRTLSLSHNKLSSNTVLAITAALCINSSLKELYLYGNKDIDELAYLEFVKALRLNPTRDKESRWNCDFGFKYHDFDHVNHVAKNSSPPAMLEFLLCMRLDTEKIEIKKH